MHIGCTNEFVSVQYDSITSTITCDFLDEMDISIKSCSVMYGQCDQMLVHGSQQNGTANSITLRVPETFECYKVRASNDTFTIIVEGRMSMNTGKIRVQITTS